MFVVNPLNQHNMHTGGFPCNLLSSLDRTWCKACRGGLGGWMNYQQKYTGRKESDKDTRSSGEVRDEGDFMPPDPHKLFCDEF